MAGRKVIRRIVTRGRILALGALSLAMLSGGIVATTAGFTSSAESKITVTSGTVSIKVGGASKYDVDLGSTWKPGDVVTRTITMTNDGTLPLTYTVKASGSGTLAKKLDVSVTSGGLRTFSGKLNVLSTSASPVLAAGKTQVLLLQVTWPSGTDDDLYQNTSGDTTLTFSAIQ